MVAAHRALIRPQSQCLSINETCNLLRKVLIRKKKNLAICNNNLKNVLIILIQSKIVLLLERFCK